MSADTAHVGPSLDQIIGAISSALPKERWSCSDDASGTAISLQRQRRHSVEAVKALFTTAPVGGKEAGRLREDVVERVAKALGLHRYPGGSTATNPPTRWPADRNDRLSGRDGTVPLTWDCAEQCRAEARVMLAAFASPPPVEGLRILSDRATPGPWAWEQCGEKEDVPVVGIAFPGDDPDCTAPYEGEFRDSGASRMTIAYDWQSCDGHSPSANAAFAVACVNFVRTMLDASPATSDSLREALEQCERRAEMQVEQCLQRADGRGLLDAKATHKAIAEIVRGALHTTNDGKQGAAT